MKAPLFWILVAGLLTGNVSCEAELSNPEFDGNTRAAIDNLLAYTPVNGTIDVQASVMMENKITKV